jgi:putative intracellular protease/amidase
VAAREGLFTHPDSRKLRKAAMMTRFLVWGVLGVVLVSGVGFGAWLWSLPPAPVVAAPPAIGREEVAATLEALKPWRRARPLIAIVGANGATRTETTDYVMPYGILRRADVADVLALATGPGTVRLYPALQAEPDATLDQFDAQHPEGADYVIVPAMSRDDDPAVRDWLRGQHAKGAMIISVCAGAKVIAAAGLLDARRATTHWYYRRELLGAHPTIRFVSDRRFIVDGKVATTTGITASMPMMLTLIEAIGGRDRAEMVAGDLGVSAWDARHASAAFLFSRPFATTVLGNLLAIWSRERIAIRLTPGIDEVSLALVADAWSRTYRSQVETIAADDGLVMTRSGLRIRPDRSVPTRSDAREIDISAKLPAQALDESLVRIGDSYGAATAEIVAAQLEYPGRRAE